MEAMHTDKENRQNGGASLSSSLEMSLPTKTASVATLICEKFQGAVWVGFGCVDLNCTTSREFKLVNPSSQPVTITIDKCPAKKGFAITLGARGGAGSCVTVNASDSVSGYVNWSPTDNISVRETATLLLDNKHKLQLTLHGIAGMGTVSFCTCAVLCCAVLVE